MKHLKKSPLALSNSTLAASSFKFYLKLLAGYLQTHASYDCLKSASDSLRARDFLKLYEAADSLSGAVHPDASTHLVANQFALLVKKYPWPKGILPFNPEQNAIDAFYKAERRCSRINRKFAFLQTHESRDKMLDEGRAARRWIRRTIGSTPNYKRIFSKCDFGPGAAVGVHGNATNFSAKLLADRWTVTPGAIHHGYAAVRQNFHLWESLLEKRNGYYCYDEIAAFGAYLRRIHVIEYNKICLVEKTAKIRRTIAAEPLLNGLVQKGIDLELRDKLLSRGLDLSIQEINQEMAREGSLDDTEDGYVTIDMKSASDSVSRAIVDYLFPEDWVRLFKRTRSTHYMLDGKVNPYSKTCSMGNGFCFPVETLIFASACFAVGEGSAPVDFRVYGDDIIIRKRHAASVIKLLNHWGFKINPDKTFLEGPFRESCGADWFSGQDVRPFTLDYVLDSVQNLFKFLNLTRRSVAVERLFLPLRNMVLDRVPEQFKFFRPYSGNVDTGIDSIGDEFLTSRHCVWETKHSRWAWKELSFEPVDDTSTIIKGDHKQLLMGEALRGSEAVAFGQLKGSPRVTLRNRTKTRVVRKCYTATSNWLPSL